MSEPPQASQIAACRALCVGIGLLGLTCEAFAQDTAVVVGQALALAALAGGAIAGALAGYRNSPPKTFWPAFGIFVGVIAVAASTRAESMAIVPLALVVGGVAGVVPFAVAFFAVRWCWRRIRGRLRRDT